MKEGFHHPEDLERPFPKNLMLFANVRNRAIIFPPTVGYLERAAATSPVNGSSSGASTFVMGVLYATILVAKVRYIFCSVKRRIAIGKIAQKAGSRLSYGPTHYGFARCTGAKMVTAHFVGT